MHVSRHPHANLKIRFLFYIKPNRKHNYPSYVGLNISHFLVKTRHDDENGKKNTSSLVSLIGSVTLFIMTKKPLETSHGISIFYSLKVIHCSEKGLQVGMCEEINVKHMCWWQQMVGSSLYIHEEMADKYLTGEYLFTGCQQNHTRQVRCILNQTNQQT